MKERITNIFLNRGIDIQGLIRMGDDLTTCNIASGVSVAKAVDLFHLHADGEIVVEYTIHPDFYDEDVKMYERRIKALISKCDNLEAIKSSENKVIQGHVFDWCFVSVLKYNRD
tara:strand:+ start:312 stop:653 length:342 start_codon:yes stop_codon:yes gene_type:complete